MPRNAVGKRVYCSAKMVNSSRSSTPISAPIRITVSAWPPDSTSNERSWRTELDTETPFRTYAQTILTVRTETAHYLPKQGEPMHFLALFTSERQPRSSEIDYLEGFHVLVAISIAACMG